MKTRNQLLEAIATKIIDYRVGEVSRPTPEHVERWINQFPQHVQLGILAELNHVFEKTYFSKKNVQDFIQAVILSPSLVCYIFYNYG